jgi:hypothetical protein
MPDQSITDLLTQLCGANEVEREAICSQLEACGAPSDNVQDELSNLLQHSADSLQKYWCLTLLGRLQNVESDEPTDLVADFLPLPHELEVRQRAAWAMGQLKRVSSKGRTALEEAAGDADPRLSRLAQKALDGLSSVANS